MNSLSLRTLLLTLVLLALHFNSSACDRSGLTLVAVTPSAIGFRIDMELCIAGGVLGSTTGAGNETRDFGLAIFGDSLFFAGFGPMNLTSDTLGNTFTGQAASPPTISPFLSGLPDSAGIVVVYTNAGGLPYTCISSTNLCGSPHADCKDIWFNMTDLPDSIAAIGIEGQGNPAMQCHRPSFEPLQYQDHIIRFNTATHLNPPGVNPLPIYLGPNPAQEQIKVSYLAGLSGESELEIRNELGQVVVRHSRSTAPGTNNLVLDIAQLAAGPYFVSIRDQEGYRVRRFVKQ